MSILQYNLDMALFIEFWGKFYTFKYVRAKYSFVWNEKIL